ncbi:MAG: hypothetical protein JW760_13325 [Spirochaetales bacterium]|nr:hypothetical protein [Spirochaetales bacterium]
MTILAASLVLSCPIPFDADELSVLQDLTAPAISITTPLAGSAFESIVTISGTVVDYDRDGTARTENPAAYIKSAGYSIQRGEAGETALALGDDGSFSFSIETADYESQITVVVNAMDRNGNTGTASITLVPDADGPFLVITSPQDYGEYATVITLSGCVCNSVSDTAATEVAETVTYKLPGTSISGSLTIDSDGVFTTIIDVSSLSGDHAIEITASDLNGNQTTAVITIVKPDSGGDISGFSVTPGNKRVLVSWDPVPFAESYTLNEYRYGQEVAGIGAESDSYIWEGLENGTLYSFRLTAVIPDSIGSDALSFTAEVIPMTSRTLTPWVKESGQESVSIEWRGYPDIDTYIVERSLSAQGPWRILRVLSDTGYTDDSVERDTAYCYRVTPYDHQEVTSGWIQAETGLFANSLGAYQGTVDGVDSANGIAVSGGCAFVGNSFNLLSAVDISDPLAPAFIASGPPSSGGGRQIAISGTWAFIAAGVKGLAAIDISDPAGIGSATPVFCDTVGTAMAVAISGTWACVADGSGGLALIDISDPSGIHSVVPIYACTGSYPDWYGQIYSVTVSAGYAFVADSTNYRLTAVDISDPVNAGTVEPIYCPLTYRAYEIAISGSYAFAACATYGLAVIDISDPAGIASVTPVYKSCGTVTSVFAHGSRVYTNSGPTGYKVMDISDPADPILLGSRVTPGLVTFFYADDSLLLLSMAAKGLGFADISHPTGAASAATACRNTSGNPYAVAVSGGWAFVGCSSSGLAAIDISDPSNPGVPVYCDTAGNAQSLAVSADWAFVADGSGGLAAINISDPGALDLVTPVYCDTFGTANNVFAAGEYAYVAGSTGLSVIDISEPSKIDTVTPVTCLITGGVKTVVVSGSTAYIATGEMRIAIVDVSDPMAIDLEIPVYYDTTVNAGRIALCGDWAFVVCGSSGLAAIDISNPAGIEPVTPIYCDTSGNAQDLEINGSWAYVADAGGIAAIDVSNPSLLNTVTPVYYPVTGNASGVAVTGRWAFVSAYYYGLACVELSGGE